MSVLFVEDKGVAAGGHDGVGAKLCVWAFGELAIVSNSKGQLDVPSRHDADLPWTLILISRPTSFD